MFLQLTPENKELAERVGILKICNSMLQKREKHLNILILTSRLITMILMYIVVIICYDFSIMD